MTLLDLLKTNNHLTRIRIHYGSEDKYFDIKADQRDAFVAWLGWMGIYDTVKYYYEGDIESWNVQNVTFTKQGKDGSRIDTTERVLFIKMNR